MKAWIITIPKKTKWEDYQLELDAALQGEILNFRVMNFPRKMEVGDRCYIVWNGKVRGWMEITGMVTADQPWQCTTTGQIWPAGNYIQRSGPFNEIDGPEMTGFRGIRKYYLDEY